MNRKRDLKLSLKISLTLGSIIFLSIFIYLIIYIYNSQKCIRDRLWARKILPCCIRLILH